VLPLCSCFIGLALLWELDPSSQANGDLRITRIYQDSISQEPYKSYRSWRAEKCNDAIGILLTKLGLKCATKYRGIWSLHSTFKLLCRLQLHFKIEYLYFLHQLHNIFSNILIIRVLSHFRGHLTYYHVHATLEGTIFTCWNEGAWICGYTWFAQLRSSSSIGQPVDDSAHRCGFRCFPISWVHAAAW
jgi:hypothetical protein